MDAKKKKYLEETYERILNVGFCIVPYEDISDIIGPDPMVYGTAKDERILSFEGVEALFKSQYEQMGNMKPGYERKRIALRISNGGNNACIIEELTITLSSVEEIHTIFMRATCVMEYLDNQWKLTHWHTSTPVDTENDPWHMEEWKREKEKLQQLVDEQTAALKQNNRELQIEAALEKIRSSSLAMQKTDDLRDVVKVLFEQMQGLSVDMGFASVSIFIFEEGSRNIRQWLPLPDGVSSLSVPYFDHPISSDLFDAKESGEDFFTKIYTLEEKNTWIEHGFEHTDYRDLPVDFKSSLLKAPGYAMAITLAKNSGICIPSFEGKLPTPENIQIMKRVGKVFEQAYIRFLDLQKAEAQAREAQIESALERVRSRSLGMHHSSELSAVVDTLLREFTNLEFTLTFCIINLIDGQDMSNTVWAANPEEGKDPESYYMKFEDYPFHHAMWDAWKAQKKRFVYTIEGEEKKIYDEYLYNDTEFRRFPKHIQDSNKALERYVAGFTFFKFSGLQTVSLNPISEDELEILERFGRVFEQAYTRFLDLKKSEAQAREAQIEVALEKIRSRTMAMQKAEELGEVATVLFKEMNALVDNLWTCGFVLCEPNRQEDEWWLSLNNGLIQPFFLPNIGDYAHESLYEGWKNSESYRTVTLQNEVLQEHYDWLMNIPISRKIFEEMEGSGIPRPNWQRLHAAYFKTGYLVIITEVPCEEEEIFKRFAQVFDLTYTRFLDLKKAEAQAREAQIESALERVRSRTMAMHSSQDVDITVTTLFDELLKLGVDKSIRSGIGILDKSRRMEVWTASTNPSGQTALDKGFLDMGIHQLLTEVQEAWEAKKPTHSYELIGDDLIKYFKAINAAPEYSFQVDIEKLPDKIIHYDFFFPEGALFAFSPAPLSDEISRVLMRFASVFGQTYRRYLDLQKAEAQAREAQIEAALERVRSRSLAMHSSDEFVDASDVMVNQLKELGIDTLRIGIGIINKEDDSTEIWSKSEIEGKVKNTIIGVVPRGLHPIFDQTVDAWKKNKSFYSSTRIGDEVKEYYQKLDAFLSYPERKEFNERETMTAFFFLHGSLNVISLDPLKEEDCAIMTRFAKVFGQIYQRFRDLQKAEAQAREAQIEAALERVRSRTMAMHKSDELREAVRVIYEQLEQLHFEATACNIIIMDKESGSMQYWVSGFTQDIYPESYHVPFLNHPYLNAQIEPWKQGEKYAVMEYSGEEKKRFDEIFFSKTGFKNVPEQAKLAMKSLKMAKLSTAYCRYGALQVFGLEPLSEKKGEILRRFAKVFEQTYTRFLDLQKAEAQAREATKQASLDRVRGIIASMRSAADLELITPLIFKELTILGVPFIRCGVFIIDEKQELFNAYLSSPEGNSLGVLRLHYNASVLTQGTVEAWRKGEVYRQHWNKEDFVQWINIMMQQDQIQDSRTYQGSAAPPESLDLHFVPFKQGMLYVGAVNPLEENELELVQALAKAFSIAYARYEDFVKLEQAKAEIESAMIELKATQSQLVQQEKLASLGQLTAGIAHEIKNPLNFVNNFSEVSMEMIKEIKEERARSQETRDETLVDEILEDIQSNLGKIHEHGTRANGIVSSMLQHSRGGSGKMEPTDLNALIKEYVNLSFHGMRAGKSPINVDIQLDLDQGIKEVSLIKEDFTRVIINLCNNAFDAMRMKTLQGFETLGGLEVYQPRLTVRTKSEKDHILIEVADNGPGIPDEIKDKILQPFFTTKKGTEGTGLGLSITHDIIKAHGGELEIETALNKGTTFIIKLSR